jgi:hypothetical protein
MKKNDFQTTAILHSIVAILNFVLTVTITGTAGVLWAIALVLNTILATSNWMQYYKKKK